ncbi:hypothetical protein BKA61DRAFT_272013 [Leptodontidium sp. MPI-SDFR-AT-0119]|nr:hypothetical protein BKA61DRAFT_272013 [Leptodontidium sp. MPI-SDFR-AT-0119]
MLSESHSSYILLLQVSSRSLAESSKASSSGTVFCFIFTGSLFILAGRNASTGLASVNTGVAAYLTDRVAFAVYGMTAGDPQNACMDCNSRLLSIWSVTWSSSCPEPCGGGMLPSVYPDCKPDATSHTCQARTGQTFPTCSPLTLKLHINFSLSLSLSSTVVPYLLHCTSICRHPPTQSVQPSSVLASRQESLLGYL